MNRFSKIFAVAATALVMASAAHAGTYELTFTGTDGAGAVSGSLEAITNSANVVTTITGTLTDGAVDGGLPLTVTGTSTYAGSDNKLVGTPSYVTFGGLSFSTAIAGDDFNIYDNGGGSYSILSEPGNPGGGAVAHNLDLTVTAVPEPGNLALMMAGAMGLFGLTRRRSAR